MVGVVLVDNLRCKRYPLMKSEERRFQSHWFHIWVVNMNAHARVVTFAEKMDAFRLKELYKSVSAESWKI